ncbi:MAG: hypothetical protein WB998_12805 [Solirubrobacteraceae bacterium]
MNVDLTPALIAAGGGMSMIAGIATHEHLRDREMRASRVRLSARFPLALDSGVAVSALNALAGSPYTSELVIEVAARVGAITHAVWVPAADRSSVESVLTGVIGSLRITDAEASPNDAATLALRLFIPTPSVLSGDDPVAASRALLGGLVALRGSEQVVVRWALRPGSPRRRHAPTEPTPRQREIERAWLTKTATPGFSVSGLVLIRASKARARELARRIESALRARRGRVGGVRVTTGRGSRRLSALPRTGRTSGWLSNLELLALLGLPLGPDAMPNVAVGSRELLVPSGIAHEGRRLFVGRDVYGERPVALDATAARHHMAVCGPSGVGKSVLLARCILDDIEHGYAGAVIDPKADLVETILDRVKPEHADRIVVLDPGDHRPLPGVALLSGGDPDSRADVLTGTLKSIFAGAWGVRSDFYGRLAIRTLSEVPGASLADMGRLFYDESFRRAAIARLHDPILISSWQSYEALSAVAQAEHVQAPMARVMTLLSRPRVRAVLASPAPKLDIAQIFRERKWLLVSLAPGAISEAGATLVGAALMYSIWSAIEARVALAPEQRPLVCLYLDELATLTNGTPFSVELLAERARGLGAGLSVALQTLGRIGEPTRSALTGNVASFITFRAAATEASAVARQLPGISESDVMALGRFEIAARVGTGAGSAVSVVTGHTEPLPPEAGQAELIRDRSAALYGTEADRPQPARPTGEPDNDDGPMGFQRRRA